MEQDNKVQSIKDKIILQAHYKLITKLLESGTNAQELNVLIKAGIDINAKNGFGTSVLSYAISKNIASELIAELINLGVNVQNKNGNTALMYVAYKNTNSELINALTKAGSDINLKDKKDNTAFMYAQKFKKTELCELLTASKQNEDQMQDVLENTKKLRNLFRTYKSRFKDEELNDYIEEVNTNGETLLMSAVREHGTNQPKEVVEALIKAGSDTNKKNSNGKSIFSIYMSNSKVDCNLVKVFIENGADVNATNKAKPNIFRMCKKIRN